jgi:hypothetical protein
MASHTDTMIADALRRHVEAQLRNRPAARAFFRVPDFSAETYAALLDDLRGRGWQLAGAHLDVRSIEPIPGYRDCALDQSQHSLTWYRNNLSEGHALVLLQNRRTSDAQSLQDLYPVTALALSTDGLPELIDACFAGSSGYQLTPEEQRDLTRFVQRLARVLYQPQLRDLVEFLAAVSRGLCEPFGTPLGEAVAAALPYLGLFRCRDLASELHGARSDKLLRQLRDAARVGSEVLDDRTRESYLQRLSTATLDDDEAIGGLSAARKHELLGRFVDGQLRNNRDELLHVLQIDWREVQLVITAKSRASRPAKLAETAARLEVALESTAADDEDLHEIIADLRAGDEPDPATVERLLADYGDSLNRGLHSSLRGLVPTRTRKHADFLVGLTALAVDLVQPRRAELAPGARLRVVPRLHVVRETKHLPAALQVFQALYGGIEQVMPALDWQLDGLWARAARQPGEQTDEDEADERERLVRVEVPFRVTLVGVNGADVAQADLIWQYRSDSPASATTLTLAAERALLRAGDFGPLFGTGGARLRVPIYNACRVGDDVGDLDIHHPLASLGVWFEQAADLRGVLAAQTVNRLRPQTQAALGTALDELEQAWGRVVAATDECGLFGADITGFVAAYERLLHVAITNFQTGQEIQHGYRVLNQAWMIGPPGFESWTVMPLLHPLKLLWWRERARYFNGVVTRLLDPSAPAGIVDEQRYLREFAATYGSSQFPPLLALPPGEGRPAERFLPAEETDGYELFFREEARAEAFGLDTDLLAEDENEIAAQRAVDGIAAVVQDYIETYPFVRDGLEIVLFECRNGALPGLLIERLTRLGRRRDWQMRLSVTVHTSSRGAPLFRRVSDWVQGERMQGGRHGGEYFPAVSVKVIECPYEELLAAREDTDIVILADVLADRGQKIKALAPERVAEPDEPVEGYLPTYRAQQEPFQRGELHRQLLLTPPQQPAVARLFSLAQYAASERRVVRPDEQVRFYREMTLDAWEQVLGNLHDHFNWVICYDPTIDRFLMESAFPDKVQVIRYSLGLGAKRQHNLTVSSSRKAQDIVVRRLAGRLAQMLHRATPDFLRSVAEQLVEQAKRVSGDIVLRAAGPGAFLNELIGLVVARYDTEQLLRANYPDSLITWVLLDDFEHWFGGGKFPDLLCVAITRGAGAELRLHAQVLEAKCVGVLSFDAEALDAQRQVRQGVGRLSRAFAPGGNHLDALYWYDQLYRALIGNLQVELEQQELWELFRARIHRGEFSFTIEGHAWVFCYDGQVGPGDGPEVARFTERDDDAANMPLWSHHYGRSALCRALRELVESGGERNYAPEFWEPAPATVAGTAEERTHGETMAEVADVVQAGMETTVAPELPPAPLVMPADAALPTPLAERTMEKPQVTTSDEAVIDQVVQQWLKNKAQQLERALRQRGVQLQRINHDDADVGPSIVRFKLRLSGNETVKKLQGAALDLARDLSLTRTPFIDNVLGTNFVGVDIPRQQPEVIELLPLLRALGRPASGDLPIIIGKTPDGKMYIDDLATFPHVLVAGATGSGKSVFLRSVLLSLITQYQPGQVELLIVDPKQTDFSFFDGLPYLRGGKVFTDATEARDVLLELVRMEMPRRQQLMRGRSMRLKEFNKRFPDEALPPIVAMIDEYAQLLSIMNKKDGEQFERDLMSLAAVARATSIHLVLATQRPSVDVVTGTLKANLPTRIAFQVPTNNDSRVVLDTTGAENLLGRGDMLFRRPSGEVVRLQAPFMDEEQMQEYLATLVMPE